VTLSLYRMRFFGLCSSLLLLATLSTGQQEAGGALGRDPQQQQHLRQQQQQYLPQQKQQNQQFPYNLFQNRQATVGWVKIFAGWRTFYMKESLKSMSHEIFLLVFEIFKLLFRLQTGIEMFLVVIAKTSYGSYTGLCSMNLLVYICAYKCKRKFLVRLSL
jgi:hypothetical protein